MQLCKLKVVGRQEAGTAKFVGWGAGGRGGEGTGGELDLFQMYDCACR